MDDEVLGVAEILAAVVEIYDEDGVSGFLAGQGSVLVLVPPVSGDLGRFARVDDVGLLGHGEHSTLLVVT